VTTLREAGPPRLESWPPQACEGVADYEAFFPSPLSRKPNSPSERKAKAYCSRCLALEACRAYAIPLVDLYGVWGGMNVRERARARKQQQKEAG